MVASTKLKLTNVVTVGEQFIHTVDERTAERFKQMRDGENVARKYVLKVGISTEQQKDQIENIENLLGLLAGDNAHSPFKPRQLPKRNPDGSHQTDEKGNKIFESDPTMQTLTIRSRQRFKVLENGTEIGGEAVRFASGTKLDIHISKVTTYSLPNSSGVQGIYFTVDRIEVKERPERVSIPQHKKSKLNS